MTVKHLDGVPEGVIIECFLRAFSNYYVELPRDHQYYKERWRLANVNPGLSYGMFDKDVLVGFVLNAIDTRNDICTAYNAATGVLPGYRGRKIVRTIYENALPALRRTGVERCILEVIKENNIAIKSYEGVGFRITNDYRCFNGELKTSIDDDVLLNELDLNEVNPEKLLKQEWYSWENHVTALYRGNYKYFEVLADGTAESYFVMTPHNGYVAQFEVLSSDPKSWDRLFGAIKTVSKTIKINNVDHRLEDKLKNLHRAGLENTVSQFEMELNLRN